MLKGTLIHEFTHAWDYFRGATNGISDALFHSSTVNSAINAERNYYQAFHSNSSFIKSLIKNCDLYQLQW